MRKKDEKLVRRVAKRRGYQEDRINAIVDYIDSHIQETKEVERFTKRRPIGFC